MAAENITKHGQNQVMTLSKVGIIGGGVSGLAAARHLSRHSPVVFEASDSIGGVWRSCSYKSTKLQSSRADYEFSDFPWADRDDPSFPSYVEILEYLESYAKHFDVLKFIQFNSKVIEARFVGDREKMAELGAYNGLLPGKPVWEVAVQTKGSDSIQWYAFELLVVCTGRYGDVPKIPTFPSKRGPEIFKGKVMHAMDYCKLDRDDASQLVRGKKVAVIGFKKSAIDLALECTMSNQGEGGQVACTMVVRTPHWIVPHYWVWGLPFFLFYSTRSSLFFHERPNQSFLKTLLCLLFTPVRKAISKFIESYILWKLPLERYGLKPNHSFEEDYASCQMALVPKNFFEEVDRGNICFKKASKWWFYDQGIEFDDNTKLEADVVLLATGYDGKKKLKAIVPEPFQSLLEFPSSVMPLYRGTIHPLIPNMALVGYVESNHNLQTAELQAMWLAALVDEKFRLPSIERMAEEFSKEMETMRRSSRFYKRHCISTFRISHADNICRDMGLSPWRKPTWFLEAFGAYGGRDYRRLDKAIRKDYEDYKDEEALTV